MADDVRFEPKQLQTAAALRAIAHPVRMGIMEQLTINGSMTATELADVLDESPANCSWHLRKLHEHGIVEEDTPGTGRRRPWKMVQLRVSWDKTNTDFEFTEASTAVTNLLIHRSLERFISASQYLREHPGDPWSDAAWMGRTMLWLTKEEADDLTAVVKEQLLRYNNRVVDPSTIPEGAELVELVHLMAPMVQRRRGPDETSGAKTVKDEEAEA